MTAVSVYVSLCSLLAIAVQGGPAVILSSLFDMAENKQFPEALCVQEMACPSRVYCAALCAASPTSTGFTVTCSLHGAPSACRCFLCSAADLSVATTAPNATAGIKVYGSSLVPSTTSSTIATSDAGIIQNGPGLFPVPA